MLLLIEQKPVLIIIKQKCNTMNDLHNKTLYNMGQRGSQILFLSKPPLQGNSSSLYYTPSTNQKELFSLNLTPHKDAYMTKMEKSKRSQGKRLSSADIGRITGSSFREGQPVKGQSRISYIPYEKKIIDYQTRTYTQMRPKNKRIIDYKEKRIVQNIPRQVVRQQYYPVKKVTKVFKQIVQFRTVQKKVKKLQYVPVQKKIVHYPESQDYKMVQDQNKLHIRNQGVILNQIHKFHPIDFGLADQYTGAFSQINLNNGRNNKVSRTLLYSKQPSYVNQSLRSSKVEVYKLNPLTSQIHNNQSRHKVQPEQLESTNENVEIRPVKNLPRNKLLERYASTGKLSASKYL